MAYVNNPLKEEEKKIGPDGQPIIGSANTEAAYSEANNNSASSTEATAIAPNLGSGYVNMDKYRQANKGAGQITAKAVGDKAASAFEGAQTEVDKLNTNAAGLTLSEGLLAGVANTSGSLTDDQKKEIEAAKGGYKGPEELDTTAYNTAYNTGETAANTFTDRNVQLAALKDIYENGAKQKGITYNNKSAELDATLMDDYQGEITDAVNGIKNSINGPGGKLDKKKGEFTTNKNTAKGSFTDAHKLIKDAAREGRQKLIDANQIEKYKKNQKRQSTETPLYGVLKDEGADASWGDVLDDQERLAASKFDGILGDKTFDNMESTYRDKTYNINTPTQSIPAATPTPPPQAQGGQLNIDPDSFWQTPGAHVEIPTMNNPPPLVPGQLQIDPNAVASSTNQTGNTNNATNKYKKNKNNGSVM